MGDGSVKKINIVIILFLITLHFNCTNQQNKQVEERLNNAQQLKRIEKKQNETVPCLMTENCLALLAYGLLSEDEYDIPFGGVCKDIAPDSLITFLRTLKREFRNSRHNKKIDVKELIRQVEERSKKSAPCHLSDCVTLLAYGLLSDNETDLSTGEACKDIVSDSLISFLQVQKRIFKQWQYNRIVDKDVDRDDTLFHWTKKRDINLLRWLILSRIKIDDFKTESYISYTISEFGSNNLFIWRIIMLYYLKEGLTIDNRFEIDTIIRNASFDNLATYLDKSLSGASILDWCSRVKGSIQPLKGFYHDDSPKEDFLMRYYDYRCRDEEYYAINIDKNIENMRAVHRNNRWVYHYIPKTFSYLLLDHPELDMLITRIMSLDKNSRHDCYATVDANVKRCVLKTDSVYIDYIDKGNGNWYPLYFRIQTDKVPMWDGKLKIGISWETFLSLIRLKEKNNVEYLESEYIKIYLKTEWLDYTPSPSSYAYFYFTKRVLREVIWVSIRLES